MATVDKVKVARTLHQTIVGKVHIIQPRVQPVKPYETRNERIKDMAMTHTRTRYWNLRQRKIEKAREEMDAIYSDADFAERQNARTEIRDLVNANREIINRVGETEFAKTYTEIMKETDDPFAQLESLKKYFDQF